MSSWNALAVLQLLLISLLQAANYNVSAFSIITPISSSTVLPATAKLLPSMQSSSSLSLITASYYAHDRRSRSITPALSLSSLSLSQNQDDDVNGGISEEDAPILRSLYDAPPKIPAHADSIDDSNGNTNDNTASSANGDGDDTVARSSSWTTQVTSGTLPVVSEEGSSSHVLYYEVHRRSRPNNNNNSNKKDGQLTALFLHGGPGAGCSPNHVRFFSPELYETVVLLDQRGCGRSTPLGETRDNTLELLVDDVERLRVHLLQEEGVVVGDDASFESTSESALPVAPVRPWDVILGGSWGCTLALAYAHTYPRHVRAMVLRGVCLFRPQEIDWLFGDPQLEVDGSSSTHNGGEDGSLRTSNLRSLLGGNNGGVAPSTQSFRRGAESIAVESELDSPTALKQSTTLVAKNTASKMFPEGWKEFIKGSQQQSAAANSSTDQGTTGKHNSRSILHRYYNLILGSDPLVRFKAVKSWFRWEMGIYSSGYPGGDDKKTVKENNNTVLVWNPTTVSWAYEDARVSNNQSVVSVDDTPSQVDEDVAQSLRRFSPTPPLPFLKQAATAAAVATIPHLTQQPTSQPNPCSHATITNNDYCIGPYRPFLSLAPPSSLPLSAWYSSILPPSNQSPKVTTTSSSSLPPLPPTIAIQGGNDAICPPDTALDLHHVWSEMELRIVLQGGHSMYDTVVAGEIVKATDRFGHALVDAAEELNY
ncbi:hypothetical protein ACHAXR_005807 [Thalassiosira sp. AJA248-18]